MCFYRQALQIKNWAAMPHPGHLSLVRDTNGGAIAIRTRVANHPPEHCHMFEPPAPALEAQAVQHCIAGQCCQHLINRFMGFHRIGAWLAAWVVVGLIVGCHISGGDCGEVL